MDALSSQANIAGYRAVLVASTLLPRYFPLLMTAAGTVPPAKVLVLGAGVAGLQAIATARRLGAVVSAFDVRPVVREQVESLGATFLEVELPEAGESEWRLRQGALGRTRSACSASCSPSTSRRATWSSRPRSCRAAPRRS